MSNLLVCANSKFLLHRTWELVCTFHPRGLARNTRRNHPHVSLSCRAPNRQCIWSSFSWLLSSASSLQLWSSGNIRYPIFHSRTRKMKWNTSTQYLQRADTNKIIAFGVSAYRLVDNVIKGLVCLICTTIQGNHYIFCFYLPCWDKYYCQQIWTNQECFHSWFGCLFEVGEWEDILCFFFSEYQSIPYEFLNFRIYRKQLWFINEA